MTNADQSFTGGCTCGFVRYEMKSEPMVVHGCHCRWCQRQSGGAFAINAVIEANRVKLISGQIQDSVVDTPSGSGQRISRCPKCHIAVWSNYLINTAAMGDGMIYLRVGTLDNPDRFPPDVHIYTEDKQPWFALPVDAHAVDKFYKMDDVYSPASRARFDAIRRERGH